MKIDAVRIRMISNLVPGTDERFKQRAVPRDLDVLTDDKDRNRPSRAGEEIAQSRDRGIEERRHFAPGLITARTQVRP